MSGGCGCHSFRTRACHASSPSMAIGDEQSWTPYTVYQAIVCGFVQWPRSHRSSRREIASATAAHGPKVSGLCQVVGLEEIALVEETTGTALERTARVPYDQH